MRNSDSIIIFKRKLNSDIKSIPRYFYAGIIDVRRYFTPDYVQSVAHLTTTSFRNVSMIHLSVSVVMWKILITTFCIVDFTMHREQNLFMKSPSTLQLHYKLSYLEILYCLCTQIRSFLKQFTNISLTRSISNPKP